MFLSAGKIEYSMNLPPVIGCGLSYTNEELEEALVNSVCDIVFDKDGVSKLASLLGSISETDFKQDAIKRILEGNHNPENWRVGEALAESYLIHYRLCIFPWPDGRDERKSGSSLPGADLVGFQQDGGTERFAFGEVKTSGEIKYPPQTMYGRTGLKQQMEDLRDKASIRDDLIRYLAHRALSTQWKQNYINAVRRYIANNEDVQLFGILIRDVAPHEDDLRARILSLKSKCPDKMSIELLAIYLPMKSIKMLSQRVIAAKKRDNYA